MANRKRNLAFEIHSALSIQSDIEVVSVGFINSFTAEYFAFYLGNELKCFLPSAS